MKKVLFILLVVVLMSCSKTQDNPENSTIELNDIIMNNTVYAFINNHILEIECEDNSSAQAFVELLKESDLVVEMQDYGGFEKVGNLGTSLPRNDTQITTKAGDVILYQGNSITIYYDVNTWNFTKLGRIINVDADELKDILGNDDVTVTFSLQK